MDIASIVIACVAVLISASVFVRDILRYRIRLQVRIPACIVLWNEGNQSLVVFRLIFVNHALSGRTVVKALLESPIGITGTPAVWLFDESYKNATVLLPNQSKIGDFPISQIMFDALDIPPHQSRSKWVGYLVDFRHLDFPHNDDSFHQNKASLYDNQDLPIQFLILDVNDNPLSLIQIGIPLNVLKTVGAHMIEYTATCSWKRKKR